jgi:transposase-like protein
MKERKSKFSIQFKEELVKEYRRGTQSAKELSEKYGISVRYLENLVQRYTAQGCLFEQPSINIYEPSFKMRCVRSVLEDKLSLREASFKFGVPTDSTILKWIRRYEQFGEAGLDLKPIGRPRTMVVPKKNKKERSSDPKIAAMEEELEYLRAENAYLKKLSALIQEEELKKSKSKSKPSKN